MRVSNSSKQNVFTALLSLLKVKHTNRFSNNYYNEHPHKNNLYGISKMLSDYGIKNAGIRIKDKEKDIWEIESPFITLSGGDFVVVRDVSLTKVKYIWQGKDISSSINEFISVWSGIVLLLEPSLEAIEPEYNKNRKIALFHQMQTILFLGAVAIFLCIGYISNSVYNNFGIIILSLLNLLGVYIGFSLVQKQLKIHSHYADKICTLFSKSDCNNILESKAAKIGGVIGWSEVGLGYFIANVFILSFLPSFIFYFAWINLLALPYSFWSVWYQKFKAQQWCPLCLIVQVLLWLIFVANIIFGNIQQPDFTWSNIILILCIYGIPIIGINILTAKLSDGNKVIAIQQEINSFKAQEKVFTTILSSQPYYETSKEDSNILFGNPQASLFITILTNPYCNPCAQMHTRVDSFLNEMKDKVCIQYIFSSFNKELEPTARNLIAAYQKNQSSAQTIYKDWFEKGIRQNDAFFNDFHLETHSFQAEDEFQRHETWKEKTQLIVTPTILVNGFKLPENYKIEDLRYFTEFNVDIK